MGKRERALLYPPGSRFRERAVVMDAGDIQRATWRIAHEILERNRGTGGLVLMGLQTGGVWFANELARVIGEASGSAPAAGGRAGARPNPQSAGDVVQIPVGVLDVAYYRDDIGLRPVVPSAVTNVPVSLDGALVVLCDDVLFTGRTVRAALNALVDMGRPAAVQLAVVVDRGHREVPIRPDYVGKNLPTRHDEMVDVSAEGVVIGDVVTCGTVVGEPATGEPATGELPAGEPATGGEGLLS